MQLIDTHVHINFADFQSDLAEVAAAWRQAGVVQLVHSCVEPSEFAGIRAIADQFPELSFAVGLHPLDADKWTPELGAEIRQLATADSRVVAIGETGLDFFKADNWEVQRQALWSQLEIAHALDLAVIIHCRDAAVELKSILAEFWSAVGAVRGVMHCWAGTPEETEWFLDLGFYVSFSGIVTFKNAHTVKASAQIVPADRLLVETDCPFLSPVPMRKQRRNQPAYVQHVAAALADLRDEPLTTLAAQTTANARRLFRLAEP